MSRGLGDVYKRQPLTSNLKLDIIRTTTKGEQNKTPLPNDKVAEIIRIVDDSIIMPDSHFVNENLKTN